MADFDRTAFVEKFQEEAAELLQRLNEGVILLESDPEDRELIERMLRDAHTLKGSSRMVGLIDISDVAHHLEEIMVRMRERQLVHSAEVSDRFFEALDAMLFLAECGGDAEAASSFDLAALQSRLAACALGQPVADTGSESAPVPSEDDTIVEDSEMLEGTAGPCGPADQLGRVQNTVRVKTTELDTLLNLVGEVVIGQIKYERQGARLRLLQTRAAEIRTAWSRVRESLGENVGGQGLPALDPSVLDRLLAEQERELGLFAKARAEDASRMATVVSDLQQQSMRMRMLPAGSVFQTYPRAIRDLAREYGKEVDFEIEGGETELDKKVLEQVNDPLIHIMRNAIGHGIETPEARVAAGKPAKGIVRVSARQEGDRIVIEVADDGAGIDPDKIRATAVRRGYLTEAEAANVSDREAMYMIFEAGFSTSTIITEISGRGVGMDVVREFIVEKLKGSLDVFSEVGKGTTFRLTVPLTLAIIRAFVLRVRDQRFALPTASVEETLLLQRSEVQRLDGRDVIRRNDRNIPLVRLGDLLGIEESRQPSETLPIVTICYTGHRIGFVVDEFESEQQIVIKPLGTHLAKVPNIAGVTVIGEGEVVPILHVPDLMATARNRSGRRRVAASTRRSSQRTVLICEDSFTTRELERSIFEAAGYRVVTATDGAEGLERLQQGLEADAVVTDVQMPNMTGFELARAIKSDPALAHLPVIIVTSLERDEEKALGIDAGADAYITKSVFNQDTLLDTVERLAR